MTAVRREGHTGGDVKKMEKNVKKNNKTNTKTNIRKRTSEES